MLVSDISLTGFMRFLKNADSSLEFIISRADILTKVKILSKCLYFFYDSSPQGEYFFNSLYWIDGQNVYSNAIVKAPVF